MSSSAVIDGDSGFVNKSIDVGFSIKAIAKVESCITTVKIWLYKEIDDLTKFGTKPGKIYCYEIFDLTASVAINLKSNAEFPIGVPLTLHHVRDCYWADSASRGYPSAPIYNDGYTSSAVPKCETIPEVTDILETVNSSGHGKLWILASPQGDDAQIEWFRTSFLLEGEDMLLHRFIWCSFSNIDGDLSDGTTADTYFVDKSMPLAHILNIGAANNTNSTDATRTDINTMSMTHQALTIRTMKRSVPGGSAYTEVAGDSDGALVDNTTTVTYDSTIGIDEDERRYSLVHGGSFWYTSSTTQQLLAQGTTTSDSDHDRIRLNYHLDLTDLENKLGNTGHNVNLYYPGNTSSGHYSSRPYEFEGVETYAAFKPFAYSLVDLSDLYDGVDHVVGCVLKISDVTTPIMIEDMWFNNDYINADDSVPNRQIKTGMRLCGMGGKSMLWITNADNNNYGALYCKSNSFGYNITDGSAADHFDDIPLSTLGFDKGDNVVRQMKVLSDIIPDSGITSIARNKATSDYNVFQAYNDRDSRFSGLFLTYMPDGDGGMAPRGTVVRLNTTVEQGDTIDNITNAYGNEVTIIGNAESGVSGFAYSTGTSGSGYIVGNTGGTDADEEYPINIKAIVQSNGQQTISNGGSITIETLASHTGLSGSPESPENVLPDGPGVISYWDTDGFFRKAWYNGANATTISNIYVESEGHTIADNSAIILRGENFQKGFLIGSGPYESSDNPDNFPVNGTITKYGYLLHTMTNSDITPANVDPRDTTEPTIAYVWPKGASALNDGTGASDEGRRGQYGASDYYFTIFNKGGKNNMYYGSLRSVEAWTSSGAIDSFGDNATSADFFHRLYINRLYQYSKYTTVEFENGEAHVDGVDNDGDYPNFPPEVSRYYKLSYEYDGFQDSPLTLSNYVYTNTSSSDKFKNIKIKIRIPFNLSSRISAVLVWRRGLIENDTTGEAYRKVARLKLQTGAGWSKIEDTSGEYYEREIVDGFDGSNETYKQWSDISETVVNTNVNYSISATGGNKLYVAGFRHSLLPKGNNSLAWSKEGKYSQFDIQNDRMDLDDDITALKYYNGVLLVFSLNKIYKIDVNTNQIIDEIQGFGCINKDCVVETEYGLFFADRNHIYKYTGSSVEIISYPIDTGNTQSWTASTTSFYTIKMYFSSKLNLLIIVNTLAASTSRVFTYHVLKQRWDYRYVNIKNASNTFDAQNLENSLLLISKLGGDVYAFTGLQGKGDLATDASSKLVEIEGSSDYGQITWESKDFTLGQDTNDKRFKKVKIEADAALASAPTVKVDGATCTLVSAGTNEWKITTNKKGKKIKVELAGNDDKQIYSIGIIYRGMKVR